MSDYRLPYRFNNVEPYALGYAAKHLREPPRFFTDTTGKEFVSVPVLHSPNPAILSGDDYRLMIEAGVSGNWSLASGYVRAPSGCRPFTGHQNAANIARIITRAGPRCIVRYRDGNPLHLWRGNLHVS